MSLCSHRSIVGAAVLSGACVGAVAQPDRVTITATRTPLQVSDAIADVTIIDRATLATSEGRSLVEVLAQTPGLQFSSNGGLGKPSSLFVRGLEARHVLLLIDGVRVGSATLNTASFDNLPLDLIDHIEIVRGPMTSLYGSNAMGGVVQIFTRRGSPGLHGNARIGVGSHRYAVAAGGVTFGNQAFDVAAQIQHQQTDGFSATNPSAPFGSFNPDNDGFRQNAGSVRAGWTFAPGWRLEGLLLDSQGTTGFDDGPDVDSRARLSNRVQTLQLDGKVRDHWRTQVSLGRSLDAYDTQVAASEFALGKIETVQTQLAWENRVALPIGEALVLLERIEQDVSRPGEPFAQSKRRIDAGALGWSATLGGAHDVQLSLRQDRYSQFGHANTGAFGYAYRFNDAWRVGGSYGTSFTAPSFNQLYYPGFGNPELQPEEGRHGELFVQWSGAGHRVRATAYAHRYDLFISSGPNPANVPKATINGATLAWDAQVDALALAASFDYVNPRNDAADTPDFDKQLPRRAPRALKLSADWQSGAYRVGAALQAYSARFDDTANEIRLGGYGVVDLHAEWAFTRDWTLGLRLNNVAAKVYETALGYNQPGREAFVTLRWAQR